MLVVKGKEELRNHGNLAYALLGCHLLRDDYGYRFALPLAQFPRTRLVQRLLTSGTSVPLEVISGLRSQC